jgi:paraquat-inducible protein A
LEKTLSLLFSRRTIHILLALLYAAGGILAASKIVVRSESSTDSIEQILKTYSLQNEGELNFQHFSKAHPLLSTLFGSTVHKEMKLASPADADEAIYSKVRELLKTVRQQSSAAAWWSWFLISLSVFYAATLIALDRSFTSRAVLFGLTTISVICFFVGIIAPAMVVWTAPVIPMESGNLDFVVQHQVRGIAAIIWELLTTGHWVIGAFLLLFSILTPLTKASLTYFITASKSKDLNFKIGQFLHAIGKWSMADVFVAAVLLALYALKAQEATRSIACVGLYYFIGYCLLSLSTTELLVHSGIVSGNDPKIAQKKLGPFVIAGIFASVLCFIAATSAYTYQQYTVNMKEKIHALSSPDKLDGADLVLPVHR